jgi:hypothetical protein
LESALALAHSVTAIPFAFSQAPTVVGSKRMAGTRLRSMTGLIPQFLKHLNNLRGFGPRRNKMTFTFRNRPVGNFEVDDVDTRDYPDFSDAFINYAEWLDTHTPLNDAELELLNNESDLVYEAVLSYVF